MVRLNFSWWEHLAPKSMHRRLKEVERLLNDWSKDGYGAHWLTVAQSPRGIMRVKPGQAIPTFHVIALGNNPMFIAPQSKLRAGHRQVGDFQELQSGVPIDENELTLQPEIRVELVEDGAFIAAAMAGSPVIDEVQIRKPSVLLTVPSHFLLSPQTWPKKSYVLYQHIFGAGASYPIDGYFYVGVTTRSWHVRWIEHRNAIETGSPLLFHRKWREERDAGRLAYVHHKVMAITSEIGELYDAEERLVEAHWHDDRRLNMIPGGRSGLKYLREHGLLPPKVVPMPDERDKLVAQWLCENPRRGLPAPWVSEKWKDDEWAVAQICGRDDRLSVEQVQAILRLAERFPAAEIAIRIGARNAAQVERVIAGKTYSRVPDA